MGYSGSSPNNTPTGDLDLVEGLGAHAIRALGDQDFDMAIGMPSVDRQRLFHGIDDPVMANFVLGRDALLLDEILASVRGHDFAHPVGSYVDRHLGRELGEPFSTPTDDIGPEHLVVLEPDLDLAREPPATRPPTARPPVIWRKLSTETKLRATVATGRRFLLDEDTSTTS